MNPMKKERPKGLGDQKDTNTAREIAIYANRMPTHAAAGRPKVNGEEVNQETAETQSKDTQGSGTPRKAAH